MTLCNLSTHDECKTTLVSLHGLPPLIDMLEGDSDLVKRYAAMTLCNLSTFAENQVRQQWKKELLKEENMKKNFGTLLSSVVSLCPLIFGSEFVFAARMLLSLHIHSTPNQCPLGRYICRRAAKFFLELNCHVS